MRLHTIALGIIAAVGITADVQAGSIARLYYDGVTGSTVATLTNAPIFPDFPTFREQLDDFSPTASGALRVGLQGKENTGNNFGSYIRGYLEAPETGDYIFFLASDDSSELWLSTDVSEGDRRRIAAETVGGSALFDGARLEERSSDPIPLIRGQKYYIDVLHKQGTGPSYIQVGWQRPDGGQEIIPTRHLYQYPTDAYLGRGGANLPPTFNDAGANAGNLPSLVAANEGQDVVLELDVIASQPVTVQWRRNGLAIPGEELSFLKLSRVSATNDGARFDAVVSNSYGTLTSAVALLSIEPDVAAPEVVSVEHRGNPNGVRVTFSEPVSASTATNLSNYSLRITGGANLPIQSASLLGDDKSVQLSGAFNFVVGGNYELTVRDIQDRAAVPNAGATSVHEFNFAGEFVGPIAFDSSKPLLDLSVLENRTAHFEVQLTGAKPWFYQWHRNGSPISNATNAVFEVAATAASVGEYGVTVSNEFSSAESALAELKVVADQAAPQFVNVRGIGGGLNEVVLTFDEPLLLSSATNLSNYSIADLAITNTTLSVDGQRVTLRTSSQEKGRAYTLSWSGITDRATSANSASGERSFVSEINYVAEVLADGPVRYWRFDESPGEIVSSRTSALDALSGTAVTFIGAPTLGAPSLVPAIPDERAISFSAASNQRLLVPNGSDLNAVAGPWAKKTVQFWFRASSVPAPGTTGLAATAGIWEQGAATRTVSVYLWRDPLNLDPDEAELVFHVLNNASDGPGTPFGPPGGPAVIARTTVSAGETYHVVAVFDGDAASLNGSLILYVNGVEVNRATGAGRIFNHTGDIRIAHGNAIIHTGESGDFGYFDGVIDELSIYNKALSGTRVAELYQAAQQSAEPSGSLITGVRVQNNQIVVTWEGTGQLLAGESLSGPFSLISNATSPYSEPVSNSQRFFKLR
ncbi:MAG TPA: LamG-like jellyroll fold domain-containing protein [Candidatus Kapabacteria bacterium]|nr:LamG-like jellyroll fold domain-containing protein [Candidatus Kapabacteria bacterium]